MTEHPTTAHPPIPPLVGSCDGSPGRPGIERAPDGEKYVCTGCTVCNPTGVRARAARTGDVFLGACAPISGDEEW